MEKYNLTTAKYQHKREMFEAYHRTGGSEIRYAGFECLNGIWQFAQDGITDITGRAGSGKTEFALELLFFQAEAYGKRFMLYVPDIGGYNEIRRKLVVKYYKRPFREHWNAIDEKAKGELTKAGAFIDYHFLILQKVDFKDRVKPEDVWNYCVEYEDSYGYVDGVLIDSWKNLSHIYQSREDLYIDYILSYRNELAESSNKHFITISHPNKMPKDENGKRRIPDAEDIKGGGWFANGKTIVTVDRPEKGLPIVDLHFTKVKPDTLGRADTAFGLEFYWQHSRYRETIEGYICYAGEGKKLKEEGKFIGISGEDFKNPNF